MAAVIGFTSCTPEEVITDADDPTDSDPVEVDDNNGSTTDYPAIEATFGGRIDIDNLPNYANQDVPNYINEDNTDGNDITDLGATLGRALFYDKNLSTDGTVACASCHQQAYAFSDPLQASLGVNGSTGRHSMRLINARFAEEERFFWDERAPDLEFQTTQPIQDHVEMGYSGQDGNPDFDGLIEVMEGLDYYNELFTLVYGEPTITEERVQLALAQFVRSIQSFDSRYDEGRARVRNENDQFPNFTDQENQGKGLFMAPPQLNDAGVRIGGGLGCSGCHGAPEFDIDDNSRNNGFISSLGGGTDTEVTRSPSLRDLINPGGEINGGMMHTGELTTLEAVIAHYNAIDGTDNNNLDNRLRGGRGNNSRLLNVTAEEEAAIVAFMKTLTGSDVYTNEKWSDPFEN
ncbi:MAG TPA: cytochrome-c peroxidase [Cytophagales bacterium]|nr:cytochrome-c peroxidase [Cytophagales bacterium]HAA17738.1 cytochrome-c peroxidase [Cytophagales bacterium]HAP62404.1 cytochrome-c peroxidase [Cytophagales bacterium]